MNAPSSAPERANWDVTAMALPCDYIGDMITVRVTRDWVAGCAWYVKHKSNRTKGSKEKHDKIIKERTEKCVGPDCPIVAQYRDKLIEEEFGKK
jgi:hypothetical protein